MTWVLRNKLGRVPREGKAFQAEAPGCPHRSGGPDLLGSGTAWWHWAAKWVVHTVRRRVGGGRGQVERGSDHQPISSVAESSARPVPRHLR